MSFISQGLCNLKLLLVKIYIVIRLRADIGLMVFERDRGGLRGAVEGRREVRGGGGLEASQLVGT